MIVINFKAYSQASGKNARKIAEKARKASRETGKKVIVSPQPQDILRLKELGVPVYAQHLDPVEPGSHTGHLTAEGLKEAGANGTLLNHSERRMETGKVGKAVEMAENARMKTIVCAKDPAECRELSRFEPDYIAYEPPELIGGDISVSDAKPELIEKAVEYSSVPVLTGAGIKGEDDVSKSIELGCEGVLVASGVVKQEEPYSRIRELCRGLEA